MDDVVARPSRRAEEDRKLVDAAKAGDKKAYDGLMRKYRKSVYYLALKMVNHAEDAEDITQEAFTKAFSSLESFDARFAFSTWLFRIATNCSIDFLRRQKMRTLSLHTTIHHEDGAEHVMEIRDHGLVPDEVYFKQQRKEYMQMAVSQLPERYQSLVQLRYFQEMSYEEVAAQMQIPIGTVKAQLHRARELLNDALKQLEEKL